VGGPSLLNVSLGGESDVPRGLPEHVTLELRRRLERLTREVGSSRTKRFALLRNEFRFAERVVMPFTLDALTTERFIKWHSKYVSDLLFGSTEEIRAYGIRRTTVWWRLAHKRWMFQVVGWIPSWSANRAVDVESAWLRLTRRP